MRSPKPHGASQSVLAVLVGVVPTVLIASVLAAAIFGDGGRAVRVVVAAAALAVFLVLPHARPRRRLSGTAARRE